MHTNRNNRVFCVCAQAMMNACLNVCKYTKSRDTVHTYRGPLEPIYIHTWHYTYAHSAHVLWCATYLYKYMALYTCMYVPIAPVA